VVQELTEEVHGAAAALPADAPDRHLHGLWLGSRHTRRVAYLNIGMIGMARASPA
jgi:hypothetical protein